MVFSSHIFVFYFLPLALLLYYVVPRRGQHVILILLSYVFYGWANPLFVPLLLASTLVDYTAGLVMARHPAIDAPGGRRHPRPARIALVVSVCSNLSLLGFFKYYNFAAENIDAVADRLGLPALGLDAALRVTLPLGISFYTFQSMSYAIDVYRGHAKPIRSFIDFACFVSMFPQLVAGPIVRFSEVADQLRSRTHTATKFARGIAFLSLGLAKKVLLANPCGKIADLAFDAGSLGPLEAWYGVVAYAFQIYFDFSGYSDMAVGLGLMFGFVFAKNFDSPYRAESITEFWHRWHISLSTWLREYLYIPLGGNQYGYLRTCRNLFVTMLLGGLWHGAAWNYVLWGAFHGTVLIAYRLAASVRDSAVAIRPPTMLSRAAQRVVMLTLVMVGWVLFRSRSLEQVVYILGHLSWQTSPHTAGLAHDLLFFAGALPLVELWLFLIDDPLAVSKVRPLPRALVYAAMVVWIVVVGARTSAEFIYFQF
jgi:alginate O-acetyltransferase complex protein AlgI